MSKHTPGPWHADGTFILIQDGRSIGDMSAGFPQCSIDEQGANATLAAAAPSLLYVVKLLLRGLQSGNVKAKPLLLMDFEAETRELESLHDLATAAIAKATQP